MQMQLKKLKLYQKYGYISISLQKEKRMCSEVCISGHFDDRDLELLKTAH